MELGFWIPVFSRILDSLSSSPKLRISDSTSKIFLDSGIPIPLHGATVEYMHVAAAYIDPHCSAANLTQLY